MCIFFSEVQSLTFVSTAELSDRAFRKSIYISISLFTDDRWSILLSYFIYNTFFLKTFCLQQKRVLFKPHLKMMMKRVALEHWVQMLVSTND